MKWKAELVGRKAGAIGRRYPITHEFESTDDPNQAELDLYRTHQDIGCLVLTRDDGVVYTLDYSTGISARWIVKRNQPCESSQ